MASRKTLDPPGRRAGVRLYRFGDEDDPSICYPNHRIVADDEGNRWVVVDIPEAPPPDPDERAQWYADQRDLEEIARRTKAGRGGRATGAEKRGANAERDAKLIARAKNIRALNPDIGRWELAGRLNSDGLSQQHIYRILRPLYHD